MTPYERDFLLWKVTFFRKQAKITRCFCLFWLLMAGFMGYFGFRNDQIWYEFVVSSLVVIGYLVGAFAFWVRANKLKAESDTAKSEIANAYVEEIESVYQEYFGYPSYSIMRDEEDLPTDG